MKNCIAKNRRLPGGNEWEIGGKLTILPGAEVEGLPATPDASATTKGLVKQAALVAEAAGDNPTAAEFKALLDALKAAGIMANA